MLTRREFGLLALVGAWRHGRRGGRRSTVAGVRLGVQTYSFRDLPRPPGAPTPSTSIIKAMKDVRPQRMRAVGAAARAGSSPAGRGARGAPPSPEAVKAREDLRKWRLETPLDHFRNVRKKFDAAGITIYAYNYNPNASFTDAEIDRGFEIAKALGADDHHGVDDARRRPSGSRRSPTSTRWSWRCTTTRTSATRTSSRRPKASPRR